MRVGTLLGRRHEEQDATSRARLGLDRLDEGSAQAGAAFVFVDDQRGQLPGRSVVFDRRRDVKVCEPDDTLLSLRDQEPVVPEPLESSRNPHRIGWIAELPEQPGERRPVLGACVPDQRDED
jgi:hypothetical protein